MKKKIYVIDKEMKIIGDFEFNPELNGKNVEATGKTKNGDLLIYLGKGYSLKE